MEHSKLLIIPDNVRNFLEELRPSECSISGRITEHYHGLTEQEEDQVQDEGEDRYLIFGNLYLIVASFLSNSNKRGDTPSPE